MTFEMIREILVPFLGTTLGAAAVFFVKGKLNRQFQRALTGFAAGVMTAATVWSLLLPAIERSESLGILSFLPALAGLWLGFGFLILLDRFTPLFPGCVAGEEESPLKRTSKLVLAVTLHNLPEGMAVGVVLAGFLQGEPGITGATVAALSLGIALQNFPEGAVISLPLRAEGMGKGKALWMGILSGIVEPVGAAVTLLAAGLITPALPVLLAFAAGAMLFVVAAELLPQAAEGGSELGTVFFGIGFSLMMILDVALG